MPRWPRNRRDIAGATATNTSNVLSPQDRQELIHDVVQAVLAATSTPTSLSSQPQAVPSVQESASVTMSSPLMSAPSASSQDVPGTSVLPVPSFMNTFVLPSTAVASSATLPSAPLYGLSSSTATVAASSLVSSTQATPVLHQPFVVGPGCSPVPAKLVTQIVSGKFVDFSELISTNLVEAENDPQLFFDGRIVLTSAPKRSRRKVEDIITWVETFTVYMLVMAHYFPHRWRDLSRYQLLILRTHRQFSGRAWLAYDKAFREHAAATKLTDWSNIDTQLFSFCTAGSAPRSNAMSSSEEVQPKGSSSSDIICRSWNRGQCSSRYTSCRFAHKCSSCEGRHRLVECPNMFKDKDHMDSKRRAPSPDPTAWKSKVKRR